MPNESVPELSIGPSMVPDETPDRSRNEYFHAQHNSLVEFSFLPDASANTQNLKRLNALFERIADRGTMAIRADKLYQLILKTDCNKHRIDRYKAVLNVKDDDDTDSNDGNSTVTSSFDADGRMISRGPFLAMLKHEHATFVSSFENAAREERNQRSKTNSQKLRREKRKTKQSVRNSSKAKRSKSGKSYQQSIVSAPVTKSERKRDGMKVKKQKKVKEDKTGMVIVTDMEDVGEESTVSISPCLKDSDDGSVIYHTDMTDMLTPRNGQSPSSQISTRKTRSISRGSSRRSSRSSHKKQRKRSKHPYRSSNDSCSDADVSDSVSVGQELKSVARRTAKKKRKSGNTSHTETPLSKSSNVKDSCADSPQCAMSLFSREELNENKIEHPNSLSKVSRCLSEVTLTETGDESMQGSHDNTADMKHYQTTETRAQWDMMHRPAMYAHEGMFYPPQQMHWNTMPTDYRHAYDVNGSQENDCNDACPIFNGISLFFKDLFRLQPREAVVPMSHNFYPYGIAPPMYHNETMEASSNNNHHMRLYPQQVNTTSYPFENCSIPKGNRSKGSKRTENFLPQCSPKRDGQKNLKEYKLQNHHFPKQERHYHNRERMHNDFKISEKVQSTTDVSTHRIEEKRPVQSEDRTLRPRSLSTEKLDQKHKNNLRQRSSQHPTKKPKGRDQTELLKDNTENICTNSRGSIRQEKNSCSSKGKANQFNSPSTSSSLRTGKSSSSSTTQKHESPSMSLSLCNSPCPKDGGYLSRPKSVSIGKRSKSTGGNYYHYR